MVEIFLGRARSLAAALKWSKKRASFPEKMPFLALLALDTFQLMIWPARMSIGLRYILPMDLRGDAALKPCFDGAIG